MNLWGKGTGLLFLSALFVFSSCKNDLNKIGTQPDQEKFQVYYKEFIVPSTTVLFDSVRTDNTPRFLVGGYQDDLFGKIDATAFLAFFPNSQFNRIDLINTYSVASEDTTIKEVIWDRLEFKTQLDNYHYGANSKLNEGLSFSIHKLNESIISSAEQRFSYSLSGYDEEVIATIDTVYSTEHLDQDSLYSFKVNMPQWYLDEMKQAMTNITYKDSLGYDSTAIHSIIDHMYGFALKSENEETDVLGLSAGNTSLVLYYHLDGEIAETRNFSFLCNIGANFNSIIANRASTPMEGIAEFDKAYELEGTRYIQAGTGVGSNIILNNVLEFLSTHENLIVNSVELVFENVISDELQPPPSSFSFLNTTDGFERSAIEFDGEAINTIYTDGGETYSFLYNSESNLYQGIPRRYFQDLYEKSITSSSFMITPESNGYSLNRFAINSDNIKVKLYYSLPNN